MSPLRLLPLAAAALLCCFTQFAPSLAGQEPAAQEPAAQEPPATIRIVDRIDESRLVTLRGNTYPAARAQNDRGRVSPDLRMDGLVLILSRSPEQQAAFDKFVADQSDSASPDYHHWLEPAEVGERFGPAMSDVNAIEGWLRGRGLTVADLSPDRMAIQFGGSVEQVESAFHTEIHNLDVKGVAHIANMSDPKIPAALAPVVVGPKSLHNFMPHPLHRMGSKVVFNRERGGWQRIKPEEVADATRKPVTPRPQFGVNDPTDGLIEDLTPYDFAKIYNVLPLWNSKIDGTGQTIAIAGTSEINSNDLATFRTAFGLPKIPSFTQVIANGINPGQCGTNPSQFCSSGDQLENSLDVEWSSAVAPGASVVLVVSGENGTGSIDTVYASSSFVVSKKTAPVLNVSYGFCELGEGTAGNTSYKNLWQSAAAEGISVFVASGDSGSASCDQGQDEGGQNVPYAAEYGLTVSGIASTPYNTAVGGTDFSWCDPWTSTCAAAPYWSTADATNKSNALGYVPEVVWNNSCLNPALLQFFQDGAQQVGLHTPTDGESGCNFLLEYSQDFEDPTYDGLIDTIGGGGGRSTCTTSDGQNASSCGGGYGKPSWQSGVTGIPTDGRRDLPDVSFFASNGFLSSSYLVCVSLNGACSYSATAETTAQEIGGTSAASPAMAGVMALINQKAGGPQGIANPGLYALGAKQSYGSCSAESVKTTSGCYFNDIDTTTNSQPCDASDNSPNCQMLHSGDQLGTLEGFPATRGFDLATGLGSLNVANVVNAWPVSKTPAVTFSTNLLAFTATAKGSTLIENITLSNTGHAPLTLTTSSFKISGTYASSFSQTNNCGSSVAVSGSCIIKVTFKPTADGTLTGTLTVADNAFNSPQTVGLTGLGASPAVKLSTNGLAFSSTGVGKFSVKQTVTLKNTGNALLAITSIGISGANHNSFQESNNCGSSVAAGKSCSILVTFIPAAIGTLSSKLAIVDKAPGSPQQVSLTGMGSGPVVALSTSSLTFSSLAVGKVSAPKIFTLSNKGNAKLGKPGGGQMITITGKNLKSFAETDTCNNGVGAGTKCTITVTFRPKATGPLSAAVTFTDNATSKTQTVKLAGTGK